MTFYDRKHYDISKHFECTLSIKYQQYYYCYPNCALTHEELKAGLHKRLLSNLSADKAISCRKVRHVITHVTPISSLICGKILSWRMVLIDLIVEPDVEAVANLRPTAGVTSVTFNQSGSGFLRLMTFNPK